MKNENKKSLTSLIKASAFIIMLGAVLGATSTQAFASYTQIGGNIKVEHIWQDNDNKGNTRPDEIKEDVTPIYDKSTTEGAKEQGDLDLVAKPPEAPADPVNPADPTDPVDPPDPTDPVDPVDPPDSTDPVNPADPPDSTDPVNPADPPDSTDPVNPADPADPTDPVDPETPKIDRDEVIENIRKDLVQKNEVILKPSEVDVIIEETEKGNSWNAEKDNLSVAVNVEKNSEGNDLSFTVTTDDSKNTPITYEVKINDVSDENLESAEYVTQQLKIAIDVVRDLYYCDDNGNWHSIDGDFKGSALYYKDGTVRHYVSYDDGDKWTMQVQVQDENGNFIWQDVNEGDEGYMAYDSAADYVMETVYTFLHILSPTPDNPPPDNPPPDNPPPRDHDPKPDPKPEEPPVIPEPEVPLTPAPEEPPVVEVPEPDVPLAEQPEEPVVEIPEEDVPQVSAPPVVDIPEQDVPLADVPETGDASGMWYGVALLAACGLVVMNLRKKAEENN